MSYVVDIIIKMFVYFALLICMLIISIKHKKFCFKYKNIVNAIFVIAILVSYMALLICYFSLKEADGQINGSFYYALPFSKISPFLFAFCGFIFLLKKGLSDSLKSLIVLLSVAMCIVAFATPLFFTQNFNDQFVFCALDGICHILLSLLGVWFLLTKQVTLNLKNVVKSLVFIYSIVAFMIVLNFIFKTNFFGMGMFSTWSIYRILTFDSYLLTLFLYLIGIASIVFATYGLFLLYNNLKRKLFAKCHQKE